jgi:spermidine synthase
MSPHIEELGWRNTPMGEISLRRRFDTVAGTDVYEVKLDDEFLMSSLFTAAEIALARLGLARTGDDALDVVVGGLGLGYTAQAALEDARVRELIVVEYSEDVIEWHERQLLPDTRPLAGEERIRLTRDDFFAAATGEDGFDPEHSGRVFDVILLDIDHSPRHVLHTPHAAFYTHEGFTAMSAHLRPGGVFAMWSDDPPDEEFTAVLEGVFDDVAAERIWFDNPYTGGRSSNTVYVATRP